MSDLFGIQTTGTVALAAATAKTAVQILSPTNHRVKIIGWGVFFDGVTAAAAPVQVRLLRQTSAGTMTTGTPAKLSPRSETLLTSGFTNATAEPTFSDVLDLVMVHPQQGYEIKFTPGQEIVLGGAERVGIEITAPAIVNVRAKLLFEE